MTPEEHRMLVETRDLAEENAKILRRIQRSMRASLALKIIYWVIILGLTFGAFYFIQPYLDFLSGSVGSVGGSSSFSLGNAVKNFENLQSLYK